MAEDGPTHRLELLLAAFRDLIPQFPRLAIVEGDGKPVDGHFNVRLTGIESEVVDLRASVHGVALVGLTGVEQTHVGTTRIEDALSVDLRAGYSWDGVECDSADELAGLLAKHMNRRLKALRDIEPH